ncbi:MAG TPA: zf-HC2 domain-containing protein, partial [Gemmatimonadota bacterium]|nr:zf-HC2 domain-containing protein [Gemmatimonadota bacterium]
MTCAEIRPRLDDWAAGRLADDEAGRVAAHLEGCGPCRAEARPALALAEATSALPRSVDPARDLWPEIAAALDGPAERPVPWA